MKKILNVNVKTIENGIRSILINDPKSYNSLSSITLKSLITIFKKLNKDNTTKVIILEGSGKGFSAGHNLKELKTFKKKSEYFKKEKWIFEWYPLWLYLWLWLLLWLWLWLWL